MSKVLAITCPRIEENMSEIIDLVSPYGYEVQYSPPEGQGFDKTKMSTILNKAQIAIVGDDEVDSSVIDSCSNLSLVIKWGVGLDQIDLGYAQEKKIIILNSPSSLAIDVAEYSILLLMMLLRRTHTIDNEIRKNNWYKPTGERLEALNVGLIGFGNIGRAIYSRIHNFNTELFFYDPNLDESPYDLIEKKDLNFIKKNCRVIMLCCSLNEENIHLVDKKFLSEVENLPYIINVSRGQLIEEDSLVWALETRKISGAALDVFEEEPFDQSSKLKSFENVIFSSHNASNTFQANSDVNSSIINQLRNWMTDNE